MSILCPTCKFENKDGVKTCQFCGHILAPIANCPSCGAPMKAGQPCASCGQAFIAPATEVPAAVQPFLPPLAKKLQQPKTPKALPALTADEVAASIGKLPVGKAPARPKVRTAYAAMGLLILAVLSGAYWWVSSTGRMATESVSTAPTLVPVPVPQAPAPQQTAPEKPATKATTAAAKPLSAGKMAAVQRQAVQTPVAAPVAASAPAAAIVSAHPVHKTEEPAASNTGKTLDDAYNVRIANECEQGFVSGLVCREKVRWQMCNGKWSPDPPPGQLTCRAGARK